MLGSRKRQRTMEERLLGGGGAEGGGEKVGRLELDAPPSAASGDGAEGIAAGGDDDDDAEIDDGEHVWVRDHTGELVWALSVSGPRYRLDPNDAQEIVTTVTAAAADLSRLFGYRAAGSTGA